ncbi:MAG: hypothetical protein KA715_03260 [Xanthomonadaceae bacterium]|nr:hypothetical protein [Xanthomonadaceae bacterium]
MADSLIITVGLPFQIIQSNKLLGVNMIYSILLAFILGVPNSHAFQISIQFGGDASSQVQAKIERVRDRVVAIVNSNEFKQEVMKISRFKCFDSDNLPEDVKTISDVLDYIEKTHAQIKISFFYEESRVSASTGTRIISFNTYHFNDAVDSETANTLFHETLHTMDFGHCGKNNIRFFPKIKKSIPYRFGDIVESLY